MITGTDVEGITAQSSCQARTQQGCVTGVATGGVTGGLTESGSWQPKDNNIPQDVTKHQASFEGGNPEDCGA